MVFGGGSLIDKWWCFASGETVIHNHPFMLWEYPSASFLCGHPPRAEEQSYMAIHCTGLLRLYYVIVEGSSAVCFFSVDSDCLTFARTSDGAGGYTLKGVWAQRPRNDRKPFAGGGVVGKEGRQYNGGYLKKCNKSFISGLLHSSTILRIPFYTHSPPQRIRTREIMFNFLSVS